MMRINGNIHHINSLLSRPESTAPSTAQYDPNQKNPLDQLPRDERDLVIAYRAVKAAKSQTDTTDEKPRSNPQTEQPLNSAKLQVLTDIAGSPANQPEFSKPQTDSTLRYGVVAFMAVENMVPPEQELLPRSHLDVIA